LSKNADLHGDEQIDQSDGWNLIAERAKLTRDLVLLY
jgi:hypothetical protein